MDAPSQSIDPSPALLEQLKDIGLPEPVSWWPPAPGWWILAALGLGALFLVVRYFARRRRASAYRREARALLGHFYEAYQESGDARAFAIAAHQLVRRVAIQHLGREPIARLTGRGFIERINSLSVSPLSQETGSFLTEASYRPVPDSSTPRPPPAPRNEFGSNPGEGSVAAVIDETRDDIEAWLERLERPNHA